MAIDLEKYKIKTDTPKIDLSKYKLPEQVQQPQEPEKKGIFGRLMDIPSKLKSEVETQSKATSESLKETATLKQDFGSKFLQYAGGAVRASVIDPIVSIAKTGASLLTEGQKERGTKMLGDVAQPFISGVRKAADVISDIPAVQKFAQTPEARTFEKNIEAVLNLTAILPISQYKPIIKASGLGGVAPKIHDVAWKVSDDISDLSKTLFTKSEQQLEKSIVTKFEKGVKPLLPGKTTPTQVTKYKTSVVDAVKTINENKGGLKYITETGEVIAGKTPASLQQFADSVEQTKKVIFKQYDDLAKQSGKAGEVIDLRKVANELDTVINSKSLAISNPQAIAYAQNAKDNLLRFGQIDTATTQDVVQQFNAKLSAFYRNPTPEGAGNSVIDAMIANSLRTQADDFITTLTGTEYSALKSKYGSLKAIEKDVIKANLRNARKNTKGLIDFTDILTGADMVTGIVTMNPATMARGTIMRGLKEYYKYVNDPNNIVKKMFRDVEKVEEFITEPIKSVSKGFDNLGLSIKDISGKPSQSLGIPSISLQKTANTNIKVVPKKVIPNTTTKATSESSEYLYHGTNSDMLDSISKEGLKPMGRGVQSFSKTEDYAKSFARNGMTPKGKTEPLMLRVKSDLLEGKNIPTKKTSPMSDQLNEILTKETIPPESLEIYKNGKWQSLIKDNSLIQEAKKYKSADEFYNKMPENLRDELRGNGIRGQEAITKYWEDTTGGKSAKSYEMSHRPTETGATADNITQEVAEMGLPKDFYEHPEWYSNMSDKNYQESFNVLRKIKGNPEAEITIYRASPKNELNKGDWVTLSKNYAKQESLAENTPVNSFKVKAKDIQFAGDDINEFGYFPKEIYNKAKGLGDLIK